MLSSVRRVADRAFASLWGGSCGAIGRLQQPARRWDSPGGQRVLVVAPHPDDEIAGCGGVILLHGGAGDRVTVLHVTDGRASRSGGLDAPAMAQQRRREAEASVRILQVNEWRWLGLPDTVWEHEVILRQVDDILIGIAPDVVYVPSRVDFHPDHYAMARVIAQAPALGAVRRVRMYQVQVPLTRILVNLVAPIAPALATALQASAAYTSQEASLRGAWRLKAYAARSHRVPFGAEEFWEVTPAGYTALHAEPPPRPLLETFRGLRRLALTDPLAFSVGRAERRRLRELAAAP